MNLMEEGYIWTLTEHCTASQQAPWERNKVWRGVGGTEREKNKLCGPENCQELKHVFPTHPLCVCTCICMYKWMPEVYVRCLLSLSPSCFWHDLSQNLELADYVRTAGKQAMGILHPLPSQYWFIAFYVVLGIRTWVLQLAQKACS